MKTFYIFGLPIHFLGLMAALGILVGYYFARKEIIRKNLSVDVVDHLAVITLIFGFIGARIFYVLFYNLDFYLQDPIRIIRIYDGGMSIHGGLTFAFIASFLYIKINKLNFFSYADAIAPAIILGQAIGRVGCDVFGKAMQNNYFWGVNYQNTLVHPVQVYEFLLNYVGFLFLWRIRKTTRYPGQLFILYLVIFSFNRGFVEFFRINPLIIGSFSISHMLSLLFIAIALILHITSRKKHPLNHDVQRTSSTATSLIKDGLITIGFIVVSLIIFYFVQG